MGKKKKVKLLSSTTFSATALRVRSEQRRCRTGRWSVLTTQRPEKPVLPLKLKSSRRLGLTLQPRGRFRITLLAKHARRDERERFRITTAPSQTFLTTGALMLTVLTFPGFPTPSESWSELTGIWPSGFSTAAETNCVSQYNRSWGACAVFLFIFLFNVYKFYGNIFEIETKTFKWFYLHKWIHTFIFKIKIDVWFCLNALKVHYVGFGGIY